MADARVGLVLGAGGATGAAFHRGVLAALQEVRGLRGGGAQLIVGTSAGSLVAARLRRPDVAGVARVEVPEEPLLRRLPVLTPWLAAARRPWQARTGVLAASLLPAGTRSTEAFAAGIRRQYGTGWPGLPTYVVAVRRRDGRRVVFGRDLVPTDGMAAAVAASCAIPGYFRPVTVDGEAYVDGGVHSPTNADLLVGTDLDVVVVSSPMSVAAGRQRPSVDLPLRLGWHRRLVRELRPVRAIGAEVIVVEPAGAALAALGLNSMDASSSDRVEATAHELATRLLHAV